MNAQNWNTDWQFEAVQTGRSYPVTLPHDGMIHTDRDPSIRNYFLSAGFLGKPTNIPSASLHPRSGGEKRFLSSWKACTATRRLP